MCCQHRHLGDRLEVGQLKSAWPGDSTGIPVPSCEHHRGLTACMCGKASGCRSCTEDRAHHRPVGYLQVCRDGMLGPLRAVGAGPAVTEGAPGEPCLGQSAAQHDGAAEGGVRFLWGSQLLHPTLIGPAHWAALDSRRSFAPTRPFNMIGLICCNIVYST